MVAARCLPHLIHGPCYYEGELAGQCGSAPVRPVGPTPAPFHGSGLDPGQAAASRCTWKRFALSSKRGRLSRATSCTRGRNPSMA